MSGTATNRAEKSTIQRKVFRGNTMSILMHCGAHPMSRQEIAAIPTPEPLGERHHPVPYIDFIDGVSDALTAIGMKVADESFGATKAGNRFFGLMELAPLFGEVEEGFRFQVGLRASHDQ